MASATKACSEVLTQDGPVTWLKFSKNFLQPVETAQRHSIEAIRENFLHNGQEILSQERAAHVFRDALKHVRKSNGVLGELKVVLDLEVLVDLGQLFCYVPRQHVVLQLVSSVKRRVLEDDDINTMFFTQLCIDSVKKNRPTRLGSFFHLIATASLDAVNDMTRQNSECDLNRLEKMSKEHVCEVHDIEAYYRQRMGEVVFNCIYHSFDRAVVHHDTTTDAVLEACKQRLVYLEHAATKGKTSSS